MSRSQFCVLLEALLEEVLGEVVDEELLGELLDPELLLGDVVELLGEVVELPLPTLEGVPTPVPMVLLELLELGAELDPVLELPLALSRMHWSFCAPMRRSQFFVLLPETLLEELLGEELLGVALVLPEPTLEPDDPMLPLVLDDCANAAADTANSAAVTAALRTFTVMVCAPSKD